eukprot:scaffold967_cov173-Ochromonas_danica.AAC.26
MNQSKVDEKQLRQGKALPRNQPAMLNITFASTKKRVSTKTTVNLRMCSWPSTLIWESGLQHLLPPPHHREVKSRFLKREVVGSDDCQSRAGITHHLGSATTSSPALTSSRISAASLSFSLRDL